MADVELDLGALETARDRVAVAVTTFTGSERLSDDLADLTGEPRLAGTVRDFADNWDDNREKLTEQLSYVRDQLTAIIDTFRELDAQMAAAENGE